VAGGRAVFRRREERLQRLDDELRMRDVRAVPGVLERLQRGAGDVPVQVVAHLDGREAVLRALQDQRGAAHLGQPGTAVDVEGEPRESRRDHWVQGMQPEPEGLDVLGRVVGTDGHRRKGGHPGVVVHIHLGQQPGHLPPRKAAAVARLVDEVR